MSNLIKTVIYRKKHLSKNGENGKQRFFIQTEMNSIGNQIAKRTA